MRLSAPAINKAQSVAVFAALLGLVVTLQVLGGAYASGFWRVSGRAGPSRDLVDGPGLPCRPRFPPPVAVSQQYYFYYPKVAIGVWPPGFYAALGMWFLIFGASRASALIFIALIAATTATTTYFSGKRLIGRWAGLLAVVLFIGSPLVQESSARVMTGRREHHVGVHRVLSSNPGWHWYASSLYVYARNPMASLGLAPPALRLDSLKALIVHKELR